MFGDSQNITIKFEKSFLNLPATFIVEEIDSRAASQLQ